jgi:serine/threonine protein phosphatase 1
MKTFVVGDIHGAHKALVQVLERSGFDYENDMLITLGDIVDGWGDSFMCVEELLKIKNRIDIVGNHDDWFDNFCQIGIHPDGWAQGGLNTAMSYAKGVGVELKYTKKYSRSLRSNRVSYILNLNSADIPETHKDFFYKQIRYYKDDDKNVFVHGGFMRSLPLNDSHKDFMMWDRKLWSGAKSAEGTKTKLYIEEEVKNIFIGHTTTMMWDTDKPMKADVVWNLDTGAGGGGKLTLMDVDSHEYWQSDLVPDLYPDDEHNLRK